MRTEKEIRDELAKHQEWLDEWGGEGASEEGQEWGWLQALEWVLAGKEEPEIKPGIIRADDDKPEGIGHTLHFTTGQDPELLKDDYWNWVRKMGL